MLYGSGTEQQAIQDLAALTGDECLAGIIVFEANNVIDGEIQTLDFEEMFDGVLVQQGNVVTYKGDCTVSCFISAKGEVEWDCE